MPYPPREGDLPRDEIMSLAQRAIDSHPGAVALFKFTCPVCGARCTFDEPNVLYERGECCECGADTPVQFAGFALEITFGGKP